jgi:hypothetical protein
VPSQVVDGVRVRVAGAWLASRAAIVLAVLVVVRVAGVDPVRHPLASGTQWLDRFGCGDTYHYVRIAELGYLPPGLPCCDQAFFPGYPALMAGLAPLFGGSVTAAGWVVTLVAGVVGALGVWTLVAEDARGGRPAARRAVLLLAVAPCGYFLVAVYTEALFLALAVWAWVWATRRHWWVAGTLAALGTAVRVNGLFLAAGLAVMYAVQLHRDGRLLRPRVDVLALGLPLLPVGGFVAYLHQRTGSWNAWREAEATGWSRETHWPWVGLRSAWDAVWATGDWVLAASRMGDVVAVLSGVAVVMLLARQRRWPEATYLGLSVGVVLCSTLWVSAPRYALTWFPVCLAVATLGGERRSRVVTAALCVVALPLLALATWASATRHWVA